MIKKIQYYLTPASLLIIIAFCPTSANAASLVKFLGGIEVGGVFYSVTFHDFHIGISFNHLYDSASVDNNFTNDGSSPFNRRPTFWTDEIGAALARDLIMSRLGSEDHVDSTALLVGDGDVFLIPVSGSSQDEFVFFYDLDQRVNVDIPGRTTVARDLALSNDIVWTTFDEEPVSKESTVSAPPTYVILFTGLVAGLTANRKKRKV